MRFGVVDCYNHEVSFESSNLALSVEELFKSKAYRKDWSTPNNVLSICAGELAGRVEGFDSAYIVNKSPFTNELSAAELKGFAQVLVKTGLDGLRFEKRSSKPVLVLINSNGAEFLELSDSLAKSLWRRGGHDAVRYYCLKNSKSFFEGKPAVLTTSRACATVFGNVKEKSFTHSGGVGSVLYHGHNVLGVCLSADGVLEKVDEALIDSLRGEFVFQSMNTPDWKLLFNQKYEQLPYRLVWDFSQEIKKAGLLLGVLDGDLIEKLYYKLVVDGFDVAEVSSIIAGFLHAVHAGRVPREDFNNDFDVCFDFREFNSNPAYYSQEHYNFSVEMLSLLSSSLNLSRSKLFSHLKESYSGRALSFFNPVRTTDLRHALAGFNSSCEWSSGFAGRLHNLSSGRFRDFEKEAAALSRRVSRFNWSSKVFSKLFEH
jgi:aldehyde:ferredoxin oxidoreductase